MIHLAILIKIFRKITTLETCCNPLYCSDTTWMQTASTHSMPMFHFYTLMEMERFAKIVNGQIPLTVFAKRPVLDV